MKSTTTALACLLISINLAFLFVLFHFPVISKVLAIILAAISGWWAVVLSISFASFILAICIYCEDAAGKDSDGFHMDIYRD